jgi:hypothetical protein
MHKIIRILIIIVLLLVSSVTLTACTSSNNDVTYIIQKQSVFKPSRWDDVVSVYGFSDDYSAAQDIANFLMEDGGNYRVINK